MGLLKEEHHFDESTFIGGWYIPEKVCDNMISFFHKNKDKQVPGHRYDSNKEKDIVDKNFKDSIDLNIEISSTNNKVHNKNAEILINRLANDS